MQNEGIKKLLPGATLSTEPGQNLLAAQDRDIFHMSLWNFSQDK